MAGDIIRTCTFQSNFLALVYNDRLASLHVFVTNVLLFTHSCI